ncbi:response regulator transcription factor [Ancylobacter oerskovii]|uniref:LuxR C-terminal-related transcriptional regulator n=1 Tax=Ancylobacter oerskovii TaxID=459519 RepID=A0ABW4Z3A8_9HYPH|nr:response regulator transcription factor [Ancylobacter oerskovii]MBS7546271.1 response regulator transcription factor [Ancylobacter oerskovii]
MDTEDVAEYSASPAEPQSAAHASGHNDRGTQSYPTRSNEALIRRDFIVLIEPRVLHAQSMVRSLRMTDKSCDFDTYLDFREWMALGDSENTSLILLSLPRAFGNKIGVEKLRSDVGQLQLHHPSISFAVLCDDETAKSVVDVMQTGAKGYLPTNLSLRLMIQILHLLMAGGTYIPSSSFLDGSPNSFEGSDHPIELRDAFGSHKQMMVARALRSGAPNKIIAYQLNMCESTVKVHVRNIMKKFNAKNRTEVALLAAKMFPVESQ